MPNYLCKMSISIATKQDVPQLVALMNSAYRGEGSKKGWTTEADLLEGELRTDEPSLNELMAKPDATILKYTTAEGTLGGCVLLEKQERGIYLGMLTVSPEIQAGGIGRKMLQAAEVHAKEQGAACIFMSVISVRTELIAWYERNGYYKTGETKPFPADERFGVPTQPLEFIIMEKAINY